MSSPEWSEDSPNLGARLEIADLRDLKWFFRSYWRLMLCGALVGLGAGFAFTHYYPAPYASEARLRFMPPQVAGRFVNPNFSMEVDQRLFALSQLLSSRLTASRMIESFQLYPERRVFQTVADLVPRFTNELDVRQITPPAADRKTVPTLQIRFQYRDGEVAQKVVQKLVEQVYEENRKYRGDQSLGTTEFLTEQLLAAEEKMLEAEARYGEIQDAIRPSANGTLLGSNTSRSYVVDTRLRDLRHDRRGLEERRSLKSAELAQVEAEIRSIDNRPIDYYRPQVEGMINFWRLHEKVTMARSHAMRMREKWRPGFVDLELAELDLREAETDLNQFLVEQSRLIRGQDRERAVNRQLLVRNELRALELQEGSAQKEETDLRAEAQRLKDQNTGPAGLESDLLTAKREYETAKEQYAALERKHEESKVASEMERRGQGETVELLEPATLPVQPEFPPRWARILIGVAGGIGAALLTALLHALRDPKILHEGHVEKWAGLEILAMFPSDPNRSAEKANTKPPQKGKTPQTWRRRAVATATLVFAVLTVGCTDYFVNANTLWARGQQAEKEGKTAAAVLFYRQAIRKDAKFAPAYLSAGLLALQQGELGAARDLLARAIEFHPNDAGTLTKLADITYQLYFNDPGRPMTILREVEALAQTLRTRWPRLPDGHRIFAQVLMERHRTEEAVEYLSSAAEKVDRRETLDAQAAAALFRLGQFEDAAALLRQTIELVPEYGSPYDLLYLQLMQRRETAEARAVLASKWENIRSVEAALQLAAHEDAVGNRPSAREVLRQLETLPSAGPLALARIGDFWMNRGDAATARAHYDRGYQRFPAYAVDYISRIAEWHLAQHQPGEAQSFLAKELAVRPKDPVLRAYASAIALTGVRAAQRSEERQKLESILQQLPDSPFVRYHLGRAYLMEGVPKAAFEQFERCVKLDPNYAPGWVALAELEIARGNPAVAEERANAVLRVDPNHIPANLVRAKALVTRGKTAEAQKTAGRILALEPDNTDALYLAASAEMSRNNARKALELFAQGRQIAPADGRWALAEAEVLARQGDLPAAIARLQSASAQAPADVRLLQQLASLQLQSGAATAAVGTFQALRKLDPGSLDLRLGLAAALALAGEREKASELYTETEKLYPQHAPVWLQHAALLAEMKNPAAARAKYQEALHRDKTNPLALNNLAWLMLQNGESPEQALEYALQARRVYGRSPVIDDTLGAAYSRLAMFRNAAAIYEEMLAYLPQADRPRVQKLLDAVKQRQTKKGDA